jgi:hypothetical protein
MRLCRPSRLAKQFVWSAGLAATALAGRFFDEYSLDSDEQFHVDEVATYFERLGSFWRAGVIPPDVALNWKNADVYWDRIGSILVQAREVFDSPGLWSDFEALAEAHRTAASG